MQTQFVCGFFLTWVGSCENHCFGINAHNFIFRGGYPINGRPTGNHRQSYNAGQFSSACQLTSDPGWALAWGYRIARKFRGVKFSRKLLRLSFRDFIFMDSDLIAIINDVSRIKFSRVRTNPRKLRKFYPAKLSSYMVVIQAPPLGNHPPPISGG